jgi:histone deacetylase 8
MELDAPETPDESSHKELRKRIAYIYDESLAAATDRIPHLNGRASLVHKLIEAFGLIQYMDVRESSLACDDDILTFHSTAYLEYLKSIDEDEDEEVDTKDSSSSGDEEELNTSIENDFGLGYDCPLFRGMTKFTHRIVGGTLSAVEAIIEGYDVAINWTGGWHHAQRDEASGFCYVNDIVIGIQRLLRKFQRVLYVDLDAHHGDGVENAFSYSDKVMTLSFHNHEVGYYPGTGSVQDVGTGRGKFRQVNVPFKSGLIDEQFVRIFKSVFSLVFDKFGPQVVVVQCGADGLSGDPLGTFNLTEKALVESVRCILDRNVPTVFLGGGGYNLVNTAKAWTALSYVIVGTESKEIPQEIPEHDCFLQYGPDYVLSVGKGLRKNENNESYLQGVVDKIKCNLES